MFVQPPQKQDRAKLSASVSQRWQDSAKEDESVAPEQQWQLWMVELFVAIEATTEISTAVEAAVVRHLLCVLIVYVHLIAFEWEIVHWADSWRTRTEAQRPLSTLDPTAEATCQHAN